MLRAMLISREVGRKLRTAVLYVVPGRREKRVTLGGLQYLGVKKYPHRQFEKSPLWGVIAFLSGPPSSNVSSTPRTSKG